MDMSPERVVAVDQRAVQIVGQPPAALPPRHQRVGRGKPHRLRQMVDVDFARLGHPRGLLDHVLQLADVAGPSIARQRLVADSVKRNGRPVRAAAVSTSAGQVFFPLAQRRHMDVHDLDAVEQIVAEGARGDASAGRDWSRRSRRTSTRRGSASCADRLNLAALEEAQQARLHLQAHLADFVEEQRSAMRRLEPADLVAIGAGETATSVPEQLGFEQAVGDCRAVDGDERAGRARGVGVDVARDDVLADAAFAGDEDLGVAGRRARREIRTCCIAGLV